MTFKALIRVKKAGVEGAVFDKQIESWYLEHYNQLSQEDKDEVLQNELTTEFFTGVRPILVPKTGVKTGTPSNGA